MFSVFACLAAALPASVIPPPPPDTAGQVFTATRIYNTIVSYYPYLVQATTVVVWTESPAPTATPTGRP
ncbi:hypothetical protein FIBSPDRAFT_871010 [Athelia psychrophila]|uniref:Uncharacterized protein n=1 Tax=Athelia psychrophila TaxID=1759441 RepID=A0A166ALZ9_9AGAM|nr:hypothetical protein FIBSPDRAFT_871010 [Fibularhizoctonia sp. CBS 109695]